MIVNRRRFFGMLNISVNRADQRKWKADRSFLRIHAQRDRIRISGRTVVAEFPATVLVPGVLFMRAKQFYDLMQVAPEGPELCLRRSGHMIHVGDVSFPWDLDDGLYFANPDAAPERHPKDPVRRRVSPRPRKDSGDALLDFDRDRTAAKPANWSLRATAGGQRRLQILPVVQSGTRQETGDFPSGKTRVENYRRQEQRSWKKLRSFS
ncbi:MAG TPA: hypothetical protein VHQ47_13310 [Phycisphaerae bacterium]|jgi:hypothetical protein|nr:hypothetical protein [Phycisphaerae bacterium]